MATRSPRSYDGAMLLSLLGLAFADPSAAWTPSAAEEKLLLALSARDGAPPCDTLDALVDDPVGSYESIVEHVSLPPWAPMQAARCLVENHAEAAAPTLRSWVELPEKAGLARLVLMGVDRLPEAQAVELGSRALLGPYATVARQRLPLSERAAVRALVSVP